MDCYFHNAVPSVATCRDCSRTVCATCRGGDGSCPSCRLAARIDAASGARERIAGKVGPADPPPQREYAYAQTAAPEPQAQPQPAPQTNQTPYDAFWQHRAPAIAEQPVETRALAALGYPFWPLAAVALLAPRQNAWVHRQAVQAIAFNFGSAALWLALTAISHIPFLGISAWPLILVAPVIWLVASVVFALRAGHGDDVHVPIVSDWLDEHDAATQSRAA